MLIEFSVANYRSFRERVCLSMVAMRRRAQDPDLDERNVIRIGDQLSLLRSALIYGANASGKSNLIRAAAFMSRFVAQSASHGQAGDPIPVEPFRLSVVTRDEPSTFEIVFLLDGVQFRYGFTVSPKKVVAEWLYRAPKGREARLFGRDEDGISIGSGFREGRLIVTRTRPNALFLSTVAQFNGPVATEVLGWIANRFRILDARDDENYLPYTMERIADGTYTASITDLVRRLDLGIRRLAVHEEQTTLAGLRFDGRTVFKVLPVPDPSSPRPNEERNIVVRALRTVHAIRDIDGRIVDTTELDADSAESEGTQKAIALLGPLLDVLRNGWVLFVDEIDARMHPVLTAALVGLFNSCETNPHGAQLVAVTHDTNLLDRHNFRRDQVYFTEKDDQEATRLYSLAEIKGVRNDASFEKDYIEGRYGAIPYLGDLGDIAQTDSEPVDNDTPVGLPR